MPDNVIYENITLHNITIINPKKSPGIIFGCSRQPMKNVLFNSVMAKGLPANNTNYYLCKNVAAGSSTRGTMPVPSCFK